MKKVLALALAVVLAFGMASVAFAAEGVKIDEVKDPFYYESNMAKLGASISGYAFLGDTDADTELKLYIRSYNFDWKDATDATGTDPKLVTSSHLSRANIKVRKSASKGSSVLDEIALKSDSKEGMYIKVKFIETFLSTSDVDFDFTIYLTKGGSKLTQTELNISGTMVVDKIELDEDDDYVDLSDGSVAEATEYIRKIEVYAGNGLYITCNMFKDQKYYAYTHQEITAADDAVMAEYSAIDAVIYLQTNITGNRSITFDVNGTYYVYNADGEYVGLSNETLPYSSKYYLASERIDLGTTGDDDDDDDTTGNVIYDDDDDDDDLANPGGGGDDYTGNQYDNPGTGSNGFVNVAVCAGVLALVAAGAVSMKK